MKSTIDTLVPYAIDAIASMEDIRQNKNDQNSKIEGIYESYLSQYGPLANQLGIRSAVAVYYNKNTSESGSKGDRKLVLELIFNILKAANFSFNNTNFSTWVEGILKDRGIDATQEELLLDASIALKRAIRTFSLTDKKE